MGTGLVAGYGSFGAIAARFLYPAGPPNARWQFVISVARFPATGSLAYTTPGGATVTVARHGEGDAQEDFIALSSTCPHLGCQVHWEPQNNRFFCPCHNGTFDASGRGTGGPPGDAGLSLPEYPLRVERGLLFIEVPVEALPRPGEGVGGGRRA